MKRYRTLTAYFAVTVLTNNDTIGMWLNLGDEIRVDDKSVFIRNNKGEWKETINTLESISAGVENGLLEEITE